MKVDVQQVLDRLHGVQKSGQGWKARCPCHEDDKQSLSITEGHTQPVVIWCGAGCTNEAIAGALGFTVADLCSADGNGNLPARRPARATNGNLPAKKVLRGKIVATYDYTDAEGNLLYQHVRWDPKNFTFRRPDPAGRDGWTWNLEGVGRVLFRLPKVLQALAEGKPVCVAEGEKDVLTLESFGLCATCNDCGASKSSDKPKWTDEHAEPLYGSRVIVFPDKDDAGEAHAQAVAESLGDMGTEIRIVRLPDMLEGKKDVTDWVEAGGTREALMDLIQDAPVWEPPPAELEERPTSETKSNGKGKKLYDATHLELSQLFSKAEKCHITYVQGDQWFRYQGNCWRHCGDEYIHKVAQDWLIERLKKEKSTPTDPDVVRKLIFTAKSMLGPHEITEFDARKDWIPMSDKVLDISTMIPMDHSPEHMLTRALSFPYDPNAQAPRWLRFLDEALVGTDCVTPAIDWHRLMQEWFGYCLIPSAKAQTSMFWLGSGGNGKGIATKVLQWLVGSRQIAAILVNKLDDPYHLAHLYGKQLGIISEISRNALEKNGEMLKAIIGGDTIQGRRLRENPFDFESTVRIVVCCNSMPRTADDSDGYFRRVLPIEWRRQFREMADPLNPTVMVADPLLEDVLRSELSGIFNWALLGLKRWQDRGSRFEVPEESKKLRKDYRRSEDHVSRFIEDTMTKDAEGAFHSSVMYPIYLGWLKANGEEMRRLSKEELGRKLSTFGFEAGRPSIGGKQDRGFKGYRLNLEEEGWDLS